MSAPNANIDLDSQISGQSLNLLQTKWTKPNQENYLSDHQENLFMETHMPLIVSLEDGRRILVDATDPENITDQLLSDSRCNNPTIAALANIHEEAADRYFARIREINPEDEFSAIQCVIDDEVFFANSSLNPRLTPDAANLIAEKIRRTKIIPTFIPPDITEHYSCDNWRKAFWYVPLAMTAYQFVSPLVIEQNGLWAITKDGRELELVARFEDYETFDLQNLVPESVVDAILSRRDSQFDEHSAAESQNWLCLSLGNGNRGASKYQISFFEYMPNDGLGNHLIVIKAMLDVWFPHVLASKDEAAFLFDLRTFKHFSNLDSVIDWSIAEDTEEEKQFASSVASSVRSASIMKAEADLQDNYEFHKIVSIAKKIAIRSGKTELTPLLLLCGLASTDELSVQLTQDNVAKIEELAQSNGIMIGDIDEEEAPIKLPVEDTLRKLIAAHKKASLSVFSLALLKTIS